MRTSRTLAALLTLTTLAALTACGTTSRGDNGNGADGGSGGSGGSGGGGGGDGGGGGSNAGCSVAAQFVYVVDTANTLSKFDPSTKTFTPVGNLSVCNPALGDQPFSMGVDRDANAYVLYASGLIYQVTGVASGTLACTQTSWTSTAQLTQFGMGFSTTEIGGTTDQLFIAGGQGVNTASNATLATLDVSSFQASPVGTITGWPELTGTSNAELWGFFPDATRPRIDKLNKATGTADVTYSLKAIKGQPLAWAFAAYGGDLWVFLEKDVETSTTVYQIGGPDDAAPGTIKSMTEAGGREIVGAGVSTCAPVVLM